LGAHHNFGCAPQGDLVVVLPPHRASARQRHAEFPSRRGLVAAVCVFFEFLVVELTHTLKRENQILLQVLTRKGRRRQGLEHAFP